MAEPYLDLGSHGRGLSLCLGTCGGGSCHDLLSLPLGSLKLSLEYGIGRERLHGCCAKQTNKKQKPMLRRTCRRAFSASIAARASAACSAAIASAWALAAASAAARWRIASASRWAAAAAAWAAAAWACNGMEGGWEVSSCRWGWIRLALGNPYLGSSTELLKLGGDLELALHLAVVDDVTVVRHSLVWCRCKDREGNAHGANRLAAPRRKGEPHETKHWLSRAQRGAAWGVGGGCRGHTLPSGAQRWSP